MEGDDSIQVHFHVPEKKKIASKEDDAILYQINTGKWQAEEMHRLRQLEKELDQNTTNNDLSYSNLKYNDDDDEMVERRSVKRRSKEEDQEMKLKTKKKRIDKRSSSADALVLSQSNANPSIDTGYPRLEKPHLNGPKLNTKKYKPKENEILTHFITEEMEQHLGLHEIIDSKSDQESNQIDSLSSMSAKGVFSTSDKMDLSSCEDNSDLKSSSSKPSFSSHLQLEKKIFVELQAQTLNRIERSSTHQPNNWLQRSSKEPELNDIFALSNFTDIGLNPKIVSNLTKMNMIKPTKIQRLAIPTLKKKRDVLVKAPTGSGKTLAYLIPIIEDLLAIKGNLPGSQPVGQDLKRIGIQDVVQKSLPTMDNKMLLDRSLGTLVLVISPTRELAQQIYLVLLHLLRPFPYIVPGVITGGEKRKSEKSRLRRGISILVATPGRLLDHMKHTSCFSYANCRWIVLDEGDRLLEMGFENDLTSVLNLLQDHAVRVQQRQTVLVSATMTKHVKRLATLSLINPLYIGIESSTQVVDNMNGPLDLISSNMNPNHAKMHLNVKEDESSLMPHCIPSTLTQHAVVIDEKRKFIALIAFLMELLKSSTCKVIVFFSNCESVNLYYNILSSLEITRKVNKGKDQTSERLIKTMLFKLHGLLKQDVRSATFNAFSKCKQGVLLCTDVAARGLDVPQVTWIIQYDVPSDPEAYIHRIGRTARIGSHGDALLMLFPTESPYLDILNTRRQLTIKSISSSEILALLDIHVENRGRRDILNECATLQTMIEHLVNDNQQTELKQCAIKAFQSFVRSYATHSKETKHIFHIKNLHLGHLTRNFGLKEAPTTLTNLFSNHSNLEQKEKSTKKYKSLNSLTKDEFAC